MRRVIAVVVILAILAFGTSRAIDWWNFNVETPVSSSSHTVSFHIDPGETATQIGSELFDLHLIRSTIAFDLYTRLTDAAPKFQAGAFVLNQNMSLHQIVDALQHGRPDEKTILFSEGFPLWYFATKVDAAKIGTITGADYLKAASDPALASKYSFLPASTAGTDYPYEGYLFPDTYLADPSAGAAGLVKEQLDQFDAVFTADLRAQIAQAAPGRPKEDIRTIVILPSMVDREDNAATPTDRGNVCSVYSHRLGRGMSLGVGATLLYALHRSTPEPTAAELLSTSPYNARNQSGLPPGPISNAGKAALMACINPPVTSYLF